MSGDHMEGIEKVYHIHLMPSKLSLCLIREEDRSGKEIDKYISEELMDSSLLKVREVRKKTLKEINRLVGENVIFYIGSDYEFDVFHVRQGSRVDVHKVDDDYRLIEAVHEIEGEKFYPFTGKDARYVKRFFRDAFKKPSIRK